MNWIGQLVIGVLLVALPQWTSAAISSKYMKHIDEENWRQILEGEWMIEFHAPWCPACKDLHKAWNAFADWAKDLNINVGEIDVTDNPGLSGRFLITSLPSIYHIKDGVFRPYGGPRDTEDFIWFVEEQKWKVVDTLPTWKHPDSAQMAVVAKFFKLSMSVRDLHTKLIEEHGIPPYASYGIFAGGTLLLGSILGVVIVYFIDFLFPNKPGPAKETGGDKKKNKKEKQKQQKGAKADEGKEKKSDLDQNSQSESQQSQSEGEEKEEKDVRQRKGDSKKVANGKSPSAGQKKK